MIGFYPKPPGVETPWLKAKVLAHRTGKITITINGTQYGSLYSSNYPLPILYSPFPFITMHNQEFDIPKKLKSLSQNLVWMSESDYPFDIFTWSNQELEEVNIQKLLQKTNHSLEAPVKVIDIDKFFHRATREQEWYDEEEKETAKKYQALVETLKQNLDNIQVYQVGEVEIDVYIVGKSKSGDWVGLSTKSVET